MNPQPYSLPGHVRVAAVLLFMSCTYSAYAADAGTSQADRNDGYSLFYDFCQQESQLSLLLWIKTTPPAVSDYVKRIASTAKADLAILDKMSAVDRSLNFKKVSLPSFEISVRSSMADDRKQQLLWGTSGPAFVQALIMTQSETTNYGLHVAKVLSETEPDSERAKAMRRIYESWLALHGEAYRLH